MEARLDPHALIYGLVACGEAPPGAPAAAPPGGGAPVAAGDTAVLAQLAALGARVSQLEARRGDAAARRAVADAFRLASARSRWVDEAYYSKSMVDRAAQLRCPAAQMCKTMLVENKAFKGGDVYASNNAQHYLVVVQYAALFSANKMKAALAARTGEAKSQFNFRVADEAALENLAGFQHNAVTPFGMLDSRVPVVLAQAASEEAFLWMGGGHPELKLGSSSADFQKHFSPLVLDVSDPRPKGDLSATQADQGAAPADSKALPPKDGPPKESLKKDAPKESLKKDAPKPLKEREAPKKKGGNKPADVPVVDYGDAADTAASRLALIVGRIVQVWPHPESAKLFCEKIDCGLDHGGVREIASGLRAFYKAEDLEDRLVVIIANLKSKKLGGFASQGMVLCANSPDHTNVVFIDPPPGSVPGDRVTFAGLNNECASPGQCDKFKLFPLSQPHFQTRAGGCYFKGLPFAVEGKGPVTVAAEHEGYEIS
ncbi:hypothetical protein M885DRAFT_514452 [Pelagophyceae sp. CCMP2097]|nr:hypothetical protein M885DRAFT_514452 [Pelagophyceae sp. CCMP2097]